MSAGTETASRNFTLRLSEADYARLAGLASRWSTDRTTVLRWLLRRAAFGRPVCGLFIPVGDEARQPLPVRVALKEDR